MATSFILSTFLTTFLIGTIPAAQSATYHFRAGQLETRERSEALNQQEKNTSPSAWFMYLPFQNAPGPRSSEADKDTMNPYGKPDIPPNTESHQSGIRFDRCIDTDMCIFIITEENTQRTHKMLVELFGTDVPHLRESCEQARVLATDAMDIMQQTLSEAAQIDVYDHYKVGGKHMARVVVDGQDLSELLIGQGLAAPKGHGRKNWCTE